MRPVWKERKETGNTMRLNGHAVGALAGAAALLAGGGAALASGADGDRSARCEALLAKIAEVRGVSVEQLQADAKAKLKARVDAALAANLISPERAARLKERIAAGELCKHPRALEARFARHGMLRAAAEYLGLSGEQLRAQLPGTSLAGLAAKQGKSVDGLKAAMLAPAKERLARAVAAGTVTRARADAVLEKLELLVDRLVERTFPAR
jgi:hypothetical protein